MGDLKSYGRPIQHSDYSTERERAVRALKFVKVELTEEGYLTDVSIAMLIVEMERRGLKFPS